MEGSDAGWSSLAARRAHNPKVIGSNPIPATKYPKSLTAFASSSFFIETFDVFVMQESSTTRDATIVYSSASVNLQLDYFLLHTKFAPRFVWFRRGEFAPPHSASSQFHEDDHTD